MEILPENDDLVPTTCVSSNHACPPMDLTPIHTPAQAQRIRRPVARYRGGGGLEAAHSCRVIERLAPSPADIPAYAIDSILVQQPGSGIVILLATPVVVVPQEEAAITGSPSSPCFVRSCCDQVVIKAVPRPRRGGSARQRAANGDDPLAEVVAMQALQPQHHHHPNVVPLLDCMQDDAFVYLVMPYLSGGDLFSKVEATCGQGLPEAEAASYLRQMAEGLLFMKETCGLAHHDVSLENAMLTSNNDQQGMVQIIDLGMCLRVPKTAVTPAPAAAGHQQPVCLLPPQRCSGKPAYVAPEVVREEACDPFASDIWSLGVCLYMMLTARPLYNAPDQAFKLLCQPGGVHHVVTTYESYGLCLPSCAKDLVCSMLDADPAKRPTLEEVLHHPFLLRSPALVDAPAPATNRPETTTPASHPQQPSSTMRCVHHVVAKSPASFLRRLIAPSGMKASAAQQ